MSSESDRVAKKCAIRKYFYTLGRVDRGREERRERETTERGTVCVWQVEERE